MRLGVNIDHIATLRQARRTNEPDPVAAACLADLGGADGIVVHLREDRRHIQERDLLILRQTVISHLNLEMAAADPVIRIALAVAPDSATLVPEKREEVTTEGGLDVAGMKTRIKKAVGRLKSGNIRVSLFIDPDPAQVQASLAAGADAVEIHTGSYANAGNRSARLRELAAIIEAARLGSRLGLEVAAGHGLTYHNVAPVACVPEIEELNIGHSIMARAILVGLERAVREMADLIRQARPVPIG
jgi:pyridoxine 5-phosphate synthase